MNTMSLGFNINAFDLSLSQECGELGTQLICTSKLDDYILYIRKIAGEIFAFDEEREIFIHIPKAILKRKGICEQEIQQVRNQVGDILRANQIIDDMRSINIEAMLSDGRESAVEAMSGPTESEKALLEMLGLPTNVKF
ncbi:MAG: hypothetical protein PHH06_05230 [Candidatus Gracilibacteria bacterium]|nr:hypothetical protein [Candidatus Gracilibacteria bacterium]